MNFSKISKISKKLLFFAALVLLSAFTFFVFFAFAPASASPDDERRGGGWGNSHHERPGGDRPNGPSGNRPQRPNRPQEDNPRDIIHEGGRVRPNSLHFVRIARVVDGSTVLVTFFNGAEPERVRLIGVDTQEGTSPNSPAEDYGTEAAVFTTTMLSNRDVWLQFDARLRNQYKELLAYLWTEKPRSFNDEEEVRWQMFNARLILEGYAQTAAVRPNSRYARMFAKFQKEAQDRNRGLWWRHF